MKQHASSSLHKVIKYSIKMINISVQLEPLSFIAFLIVHRPVRSKIMPPAIPLTHISIGMLLAWVVGMFRPDEVIILVIRMEDPDGSQGA